MKIILSRKGFDAGIGRVPSPIFPSGTMYSIPIPESPRNSHILQYSDIRIGHDYLGSIVHELTRGKLAPNTFVHLDPDLHVQSIPRPPEWKPIFGQAGAAERHLQKNRVGEGDIFLFFGWFRQVCQWNGEFKYIPGAPDLHVIFGWLQIERRVSVHHRSEIPAWALGHPHCQERAHVGLDCIYIATEELELPNYHICKPGAGAFKRYDPMLCLTANNMSRSIWKLPRWFYPEGRKSCLSYHNGIERWQMNDDHVLLKTVGRGQEFIIDCDDYPEAVDWLSSILSV